VDFSHKSWYPGDEYVNIVTCDICNMSESTRIIDEFSRLLEQPLQKPVNKSKCGSIAQKVSNEIM